MDESLYDKWVEEEIEDMQTALLHRGVDGLFFEFERWVKKNYNVTQKDKNMHKKIFCDQHKCLLRECGCDIKEASQSNNATDACNHCYRTCGFYKGVCDIDGKPCADRRH
jgi:hypothetical protein